MEAPVASMTFRRPLAAASFRVMNAWQSFVTVQPEAVFLSYTSSAASTLITVGDAEADRDGRASLPTPLPRCRSDRPP